MTSPVLFLVFNRPDITARVFGAIRQARPRRLYVAADGPRLGHDDEIRQCREVRRIATEVDWPCQLKTLFRTDNLGCRLAVSTAIDWFFEHEEEGIILEDDCLPTASFFPYCNDLLEKYKNDTRVMTICGSCYSSSSNSVPFSYFFSYYADMWGWATWRRAWALYDRNLDHWPTFKEHQGLEGVAAGRNWYREHWSRVFDKMHNNEIDTWDYPWIFSVIKHHGLACYPVQNLISNIGFGPNATHTFTQDGDCSEYPAAALPLSNLSFPLAHPPYPIQSPVLDSELDSVRLKAIAPSDPTIRERICGRLRNIRDKIRRHLT